MSQLQTQGLILAYSKDNDSSICDSYQLGKLSKLSFSNSINNSTTLSDKIHCGLWDPAPIASTEKYRYFVCFVDDCSRFMWLIPLKHKSYFLSTFVYFEKYVNRQFESVSIG